MEKITWDLEARKAACKILEVEETADKQQFKKAYRRIAMKLYPDKNQNDPNANKKFALVKCAYELLVFDEPCEEILKQIDSWAGMPEDSKYKIDNPWDHFLWWRDKFFDSDKEKGKTNGSRRSSCI